MVSTMQKDKKIQRARRSFTKEFKAESVRLVLEDGQTVAQVAKDLDLSPTAFRKWVDQARANQGKGKPGSLTSVERDELTKLRRENRELKMERDILKPRPSSRKRTVKVRFSQGGEGLFPGGNPLSSVAGI